MGIALRQQGWSHPHRIIFSPWRIRLLSGANLCEINSPRLGSCQALNQSRQPLPRGAKALRSVASIHWRARGRFLCCHPCRRDRPLWVNWSQKALTQSVAGSLSYPRYLLYAPIFHAYSQHPCRAVIGCLPPRAGSAALAAACDSCTVFACVDAAGPWVLRGGQSPLLRSKRP